MTFTETEDGRVREVAHPPKRHYPTMPTSCCANPKLEVRDTRQMPLTIKRYRRCLNCQASVVTIEVPIARYSETITKAIFAAAKFVQDLLR